MYNSIFCNRIQVKNFSLIINIIQTISLKMTLRKKRNQDDFNEFLQRAFLSLSRFYLFLVVFKNGTF